MSDSSEAVGKKSAARRAAVTTRLAGAGDAVGDQVARELVRLSLRQVPAALFASFICAGLVAYVTWDSVPYVPLLAWVALLGAASLARLWLWARASGRPEGRGLRAAFVAGSAIGGALWGAGASFIILAAASTWDVIFIGFVAGGMGAGAMAGLSGYPPAFLASLLPNLLPCAAAYFARADHPYPLMGAMIAVFAAALIFFGRTLNRSMARSATLRFENTGLVERLASAREAAER